MKSMKSAFLAGFVVVMVSASFLGGWYFLFPAKIVEVTESVQKNLRPAKTKEELRAEALEKSSNIKGLYMTSYVASYKDAGATGIRKNLIRITEETEINGLVIDVKEACGEDYNETNLRELIKELHGKNIWAIARIVVFSDSSRIDVNPGWYLMRKSYRAVGAACPSKKFLPLKNQDGSKSNAIFWRDKAGRYWMDPAHPEVQKYILDFSKKMADLGFDELQYDYIRFISDGDIENAIYPVWDGKSSKCSVMKSFFEYLNRGLKEYKPDLILSADMFGYASVGLDTGIGQCLDAIEDNFDYVSFMTYPSHYYSGFYVPQLRDLPPVSYKTKSEARMHPDVISERSLIFARNFFDGRIDILGKPFHAATSTNATSTPPEQPKSRSRVRLRPWVEDFFHEDDKVAGRPYGAEKVHMQVDAAESTENHGWLLWNSGNVYTEGALKKE